MLKVLICCPGAWTHGLDSPERGEGRWAQNLARTLGKSGKFEVVAASAGNPNQGKGRATSGVQLVTEHKAKKLGPFDLYFDSSWWEGKPPLTKARAYFHVNWTLEPRLRSPSFPKDHYVAYPYVTSKPNFINEHNPHSERTFFLPTAFAERLAPPNFSRTRLFWPGRPDDRVRANEEVVARTIIELLDANPQLRSDWLFGAAVKDAKPKLSLPGLRSEFHNTLPYFMVVDLIRQAKLSLPVNLPACVPDCSVEGVPSLIWEHGSWLFLREVAKKHGLLIEKPATGARIKEVINTLMTNESVYTAYTLDLQHVFRYHTEPEVLNQFQHIVDTIF
jgi:hypothetical protein